VIVEPGVTYGELLAVLGRDGLTVGIVPLTGASGTIGDAIASHGLGTGSPKYQSTGDEVAGLEVILPDGELLRTGSAALAGAGFFHRYAIGPDLTGLFLDANGTLGVITKLALWVHPLPPHQETLTLGFSDYAAGARFTAHAQLHEMFRNVWYGALRRVAGDRLRSLQGRQDVGAPDGPIRQLLPDAAHTQTEPRPKVAVLSR
jgi:FAD/FMN-containing dehydrogenase